MVNRYRRSRVRGPPSGSPQVAIGNTNDVLAPTVGRERHGQRLLGAKLPQRLRKRHRTAHSGRGRPLRFAGSRVRITPRCLSRAHRHQLGEPAIAWPEVRASTAEVRAAQTRRSPVPVRSGNLWGATYRRFSAPCGGLEGSARFSHTGRGERCDLSSEQLTGDGVNVVEVHDAIGRNAVVNR